jgi:alkanesulfonate monooxygenase SsuD/methylene tetrahydromethanopterin reductase-like flavin-dependent oxidoreductase (luciferase family)
LYSRPPTPPLLVGAALTAETAHWLGGWADALITVAGERDAMRRVIDAFRQGGGEGKPIFLQAVLAFGDDDAHSARIAYDQWRQAALSPTQLADIATAREFDRATDAATPGEVVPKLRVSADIERQIAWLMDDLAMGFTRVYVHNLARDHSRFFDACGMRLLPSVAHAAV